MPSPLPAPQAPAQGYWQSTYDPLSVQLALLQQQLLGIAGELDRIMATLGPPVPAPALPVPHVPAPPSVPVPGRPPGNPVPPKQPPSLPPNQPHRATDFVVSSFNVLGSSHTKPGGEHPGMAAGPARIHGAVALLEKHHVGVVGFQELQGDQLKEFKKVAGDKFAVYPGASLGKQDSQNSIAWRKDQWELVRASTIEIPYFEGHARKMPVVRLRNRETGQEAYFANFHNPADTHDHHHQQHWRDIATAKEIALVNKLSRESGIPVILTGDMNERDGYYKRISKDTTMVAANAGPKGQAPRKMGIDWIFGSFGVKFSDYQKDLSDLVKRTTDHPMVVSRARL